MADPIETCETCKNSLTAEGVVVCRRYRAPADAAATRGDGAAAAADAVSAYPGDELVWGVDGEVGVSDRPWIFMPPFYAPALPPT